MGASNRHCSAPLPLRSAALFALTATLALAGCVQTPPPDPGGHSRGALRTCSTDEECLDPDGGPAFSCDRLRRVCVCTSDEMCQGHPAGAYCNAFTGRCEADVAGCKGDTECAPGQFCDQALRVCRDKKSWCQPCTQDAECGGPLDRCVRHPDFLNAQPFCGTGCQTNDDCGANQHCLNTEKGKQCLPAFGRCGQDPGCTPDTNQACTYDADCTLGSGQKCLVEEGRCVAAVDVCKGDQSCDPVTRLCVQSCRRDDDCIARHADPSYTCRHATCVRAESCLSDADCSASKFCFRDPGTSDQVPGICKNACADNSECPLGQRCVTNPATGRNRCIEGCAAGNSDCPLNAICSGGLCTYSDGQGRRHCQTNDACDFGEFCQNSVCVRDTKHCSACSGISCSSGSSCKSLQAFFECGPSSSIVCPAGTSKSCGNIRMGDTTCAGCWCTFSRCIATCRSASDCPAGFDCSGGLCDPVNRASCL